MKRISRRYVGIFWIFEGARSFRIAAFRLSIDKAEDYAGLKVYPHSHYDTWTQVKLKRPDLRDVHYEDVPRGRVAYDPKRRSFIVLLGSGFKKRNDVRLALSRRFGMSHRIRWIFDDEHYQII